jgi:hypothetical protein
MAVKLTFDLQRQNSVDSSVIYDAMDQMDNIDNNYLTNGIIESISSNQNIIGDIINEQTTYIFGSLTNFQNFMGFGNNVEQRNLWKNVHNFRIENGYVISFSVDYNYTPS